MKIILKEDIDNLGARGKVVTVKDGYARNYLLPRGLAMKFTPGAEKVIAQERRTFEVRQVKERETAQALADQLSGLELSISKRSGDQDVLYGSVTTSDVAELIKAKGFIVDKRRILLHEPIKKLGEYEVPLRLHKDVTPAVKVIVVKEE